MLIYFFLLFYYSYDSHAACVKGLGTGTCVADGANGCHVEKDTTCMETTTPDGCRTIGLDFSGPTRGYYVPYGNATAWNAWKANIPATMTNHSCCTVTWNPQPTCDQMGVPWNFAGAVMGSSVPSGTTVPETGTAGCPESTGFGCPMPAGFFAQCNSNGTWTRNLCLF